ncbi:MAG: cation:proton antiporter regulatory subunit, partial [Myxococcaceae bacterium]
GSFLYPIAVAVSAATTLTTPWLIQASGPTANFVDRKLPRSLQTFASLYGSWLEGLTRQRKQNNVRRIALLLLLDAALLAAIVIGVSLTEGKLTARLEERLGLGHREARYVLLGAATALSLPFVVGIVRVARGLGAALAELALPPSESGKVDLAAAPRRMLLVTLQLASVLVVGIPLLALVQPFVPATAVVLLVVVVIILAIGFWKSAESLQGHVKAGAQVIADALKTQTRAKQSDDALKAVRNLLPGLGEPTPVRLERGSPAIGKSLAELNLRGMTGATVLAVKRGGNELLVPTAHDALHEGDILALAGTHEAIIAATDALRAAGSDGAALS